MMGNYLRFDFGESYFRDRSVVELVFDLLDELGVQSLGAPVLAGDDAASCS